MGYKFINIQNLQKAYTEGIYADTPANRKLGRVGMTYKEYAEKVKNEEKKEEENKESKDISSNNKLINIEKEIKENPISGNTEVSYKNIKYSPYKKVTFDIAKGDYGYGLRTDPFLGYLPKEAQERFNNKLYRAKHQNKKELLDKIDEFVLWLNEN